MSGGGPKSCRLFLSFLRRNFAVILDVPRLLHAAKSLPWDFKASILSTAYISGYALRAEGFMLSLSSIRTSNAAFPHLTDPPPVAVFVGGTSGIGEAMARAFVRHTKGNCSIIIVGRNRVAAEGILASLPAPASSSTVVSREFIQCDATEMKNVDKASKAILANYPKVNYLILSTGLLTLAGRDETSEGIDKKLAVHYYSRWKFIHDLLPSLAKAKESGEEGAVMSVFLPGSGGDIDVEDLAVKNNYTFANVSKVTPTYNDLMLESFSEKCPSVPFIHAHPGIVRTNIFSKSPSFMIRSSNFLWSTLARPFTVSPEECSEYMWNAIYSTATKPRAWRTGWHGEDLGKTKYFGNEEQRRRLWEHTTEVVEGALKSAPET